MVNERWETVEQIAAALARFQAAIPGWRDPAAYGIARLDGDRAEFARVNLHEHLLPAVVMATVCGHRGGSGSYRVGAVALYQAIAQLAPAEACAAYDHPNLAAWRRLRAGMHDRDEVLAVFAADLDEPFDDPWVGGLRAEVLAGRQENADGTTTLWRPVGPTELALIEESGWRAFPPRLPDQPIFYPVLNAEYAARIARDWNVPASGAGFVTRFRVRTDLARRYPSRSAGGAGIVELWVPAEELAEWNAQLTSPIEVVQRFEP